MSVEFDAETFEAMSWHDPRWAGDRENVERAFKSMYPTYTIEEDSIDYLIYQGGASNKFHLFFLATDPAGNYHSFNAYGRIGYTPTLHHNAGPGTKGSVTQAISKKRHQKSKKGYVQQAESSEEELNYPCDVCGFPADYNFQDATIRWKIEDDEFAGGRPMISDYGGDNQNDFYCEKHAKQYEGSDFSAETFEAFSIDTDDEGKIHIENECDGCGKEFYLTQNPNIIGGERAGAIVYEWISDDEHYIPAYSPTFGGLYCKTCYREEAEEDDFQRYNRGQGQIDYDAEEPEYETVELAKPVRTGWSLGAGLTLWTISVAAVTSLLLGATKNGDE